MYIPAHKRRRRADGGWEVNDSTSTASAGLNITNVTLSNVSSDDSTGFAVPSLSNSFNYSHDLVPLPPLPLLPSEAEAAAVDYDAFLRSPSPLSSARLGPMQSTPMSQIPPPSQPVASQAASQVAPSADMSSASSAQQVSPAQGAFATQAPPPSPRPLTVFGFGLPPISSQPSQSQNSNSSHSNSTSNPSPGGATRQSIAFGAQVAKTPGRKVSASGFTWGLGKK